MKYSNKKLIYDDHCPLCRWYSAQFVKFGFLHPDNRVPFSKASEEMLTAIDFNRATDEIPYVDVASQETTYGLDALLEILSIKFPLIGRIGNIKPIHYFFRKLYKLVSLNRKVIVATKCGPDDIDCSPSFSPKYRWLFVLMGIIFLFVNSKLFYSGIVQTYRLNLTYQQFLIASTIFGIASYSPALFLSSKKSMEFIGQHAVLGIILAVSLLLITTVQRIYPLNDWFVYLFHIIIGYALVREYERRMSYLFYNKQPAFVWYTNYSTLAGFLAIIFINSNK